MNKSVSQSGSFYFEGLKVKLCPCREKPSGFSSAASWGCSLCSSSVMMTMRRGSTKRRRRHRPNEDRLNKQLTRLFFLFFLTSEFRKRSASWRSADKQTWSVESTGSRNQSKLQDGIWSSYVLTLRTVGLLKPNWGNNNYDEFKVIVLTSCFTSLNFISLSKYPSGLRKTSTNCRPLLVNSDCWHYRLNKPPPWIKEVKRTRTKCEQQQPIGGALSPVNTVN